MSPPFSVSSILLLFCWQTFERKIDEETFQKQSDLAAIWIYINEDELLLKTEDLTLKCNAYEFMS